MSVLTEGDIVVLVSGSPRLAVEKITGKAISVVWINEGSVNRDTFDIALIRKWEAPAGGDRGGDRGGFKGGDRGGDRGGFKGGDRGGKGGFKGGDRGGDRGGDKGRGKPFEGKSFDKPNKDKSFFRKD
ncbi:hypothetical protein [Paramylibacter kogurei]|uniref:hypothetical protein n=1 Tax=Paramylibacter kogurei TaxID=1889778 RepID=UPI000C147218|nr:hypothetical protein [Amylibacter kogurei]